MDPTPVPTSQRSRGKYFLGLGLGSIPLVPLLIGTSVVLQPAPSEGVLLFYLYFFVAFCLYLVVLIATIVCLSIKRVLWVGYGLLTTLLVTPVVAAIGCVVALRPH